MAAGVSPHPGILNRPGMTIAGRLPPLLLLAGLTMEAQPQVPDSFRISVDVDLVVLHATVRDRAGHFAADPRKGDFEIYENGFRQAVRLFGHEDTPVTVGLVVDHKREHAAEALRCGDRGPNFRAVQQPGGPDVRRQLQRERHPGSAGRHSIHPSPG